MILPSNLIYLNGIDKLWTFEVEGSKWPKRHCQTLILNERRPFDHQFNSCRVACQRKKKYFYDMFDVFVKVWPLLGYENRVVYYRCNRSWVPQPVFRKWQSFAAFVVEESLCDLNLPFWALKLSIQDHLMEIEWLITDVTVVDPPISEQKGIFLGYFGHFSCQFRPLLWSGSHFVI